MISKRARNMAPSMTLGINAKVKSLEAEGKKIIDLSIGEPDFLTPDVAKEAGKAAIDNNMTRYGPAAGSLPLRQAIAKKLKEENQVEYAPTDIVVTSGAKHALTIALTALLDPGDEVIIPVPYWVSYPEIVKLVEGVPVFVEGKKENDFKLTFEEVAPYLTSRTKAIILTNPSNPTGAVYFKDELDALVTPLVEKGLMVLSDEIYERQVYGGDFVSVASLSPKVKEHTILINGLSKSAAMTGWRIGYTASESKLAKVIGDISSHLVSHPSTVSQEAARAALEHAQGDMEERREQYKQRRDYILDFLKDVPGIASVAPEGAFYVFLDISSLRDKVKGDSLSLEVCEALLDQHQVALVPGIGFGADDFLRLSYAASMEDIKEALHRIKVYMEQWQ
ncbi:MAG TPA: pyridoxal phosphate-dependent aminotransferase [Tissierellia bacterium]|jgi:aspartate aminotransferase|nr:pyridoxal phosphate-dependent aminotransferase [Tissierellia bacterium]